MLHTLKEFISNNLSISIAIVTLILTLTSYFYNKKFRFMISDLIVRFPYFGVIDRHIREKDVRNTDINGFYSAESNLCSIYYKYISLLDRNNFENRLEYIKLAGDLGKRTMPAYLLLILMVLVVAEALGFSYMLGEWMAMEASENTHTLLMYAIVTVIAIVMLMITHAAGKELNKTKLLKAWHEEANEFSGQREHKVIKLNDPQSIDEKFPAFQRGLNRVAKTNGDKGSYFMLTVAIISIVVIAVVSFYMRYQQLEQTLNCPITHQVDVELKDPFGDDLPPNDTKEQKESTGETINHLCGSKGQEGMAAFVMLSFIFVITQVVGIYTGYEYSFAGKQSKRAYEEVDGDDTYEKYQEKSRLFVDTANNRLKQLQKGLSSRINNPDIVLNKTFEDYCLAMKKQS